MSAPLASARRRRRVIPCLIGVAGAVVAFAAPSSASAAVGCEASALRGSVLGGAVAPFTANGNAAACAPDKAGLADPVVLPALLSASALTAETTLQGSAAAPVGHATAGAADLRVGGVLPTSLVPSLGDQIIPLDLGLLGTLPVDIGPALRALLEPIDATELLHAGAVQASADVACVNGQPRISGSSSIATLTLAGRSLPVNQPLTETVALVDTQRIDPSDIDLAKVVLPLGIDLGIVAPVLRPVLDGLPDIVVPPTVAHVKLTPAQHIVDGSTHTWRALQAKIDVAGVSVADLVVGEASVSATPADCAGSGGNPDPNPQGPGRGPQGGAGPSGAPPRSRIADAALACTRRRVVLTDVMVSGGRVALQGVAHRAFAGRRVAIRLTATRTVVARPVVGRDGRFSATAALPARSIRHTNKARYVASVGKERSLALKLMRRMALHNTTVARGRVTLRGRVIRPYKAARQPIVVQRRLACGKWRQVKRVLPTSGGRFKVKLKAPAGGSVAVYRMKTKVTWRSNPSRLTRTYTLPRYVEG